MSRFLAKVVVFGWWVAKAPNFAQTLCDGFAGFVRQDGPGTLGCTQLGRGLLTVTLAAAWP